MNITSEAIIGRKFTINGEYTDAIYKTQEQWNATTPEQFEAECTARYDNWKAIVNTPAPEPTEEEKAAQVESLKSQIDMAQAQIATLADAETAAVALTETRDKIDATITALEVQQGA
jgi:hypothetical protein